MNYRDTVSLEPKYTEKYPFYRESGSKTSFPEGWSVPSVSKIINDALDTLQLPGKDLFPRVHD